MPGFDSLCQRFKFLRFVALPVAALQRTMHSVTGCYVFIFFFNPQGIRDQGGEQEEVRGGGRRLKIGVVCGWVGRVEAA